MFDTIYNVVVNGKIEIAFDTEESAVDYIESMTSPYFNRCMCLQIIPTRIWRI